MKALSELKTWDDNYNQGDIEAIERSIRRYGFINSLRVWRGDEIRGGNHSYLALCRVRDSGAKPELDRNYPPEGVTIREDGEWMVMVTDISYLEPLEATAYAIADNELTRKSTYDEAVLVRHLREISIDPTLFQATGFTDDEFDKLQALADITDVRVGDDASSGDELPDRGAELQAIYNVQSGDIWQMGQHRLICGDCRDEATMTRLFGGRVMQIAVTSPPYAEQRANDYGGIPADEYVGWWQALQALVALNMVKGGSFFVNIKPHTEDGERSLYVFDLVLSMRRAWNWQFVDEFCWQRSSVPGKWKDRFRNGFEPVYQFRLPGDIGKFHPYRVGHQSDEIMVSTKKAGKKAALSTGTYYNFSGEQESGVAAPDNVISIKGVESGIGHPAMFPNGLPEFFIKVYSDPGDIVFDPFMGSGTTMLAAHRNNRIGYGCELKPEYCAIILQRMVDEGLDVKRVDNG